MERDEGSPQCGSDPGLGSLLPSPRGELREVAWCLGTFEALGNTLGAKNRQISWKNRWSPAVRTFQKALL